MTVLSSKPLHDPNLKKRNKNLINLSNQLTELNKMISFTWFHLIAALTQKKKKERKKGNDKAEKRLDGEKEDKVSVSLWLIALLLSGSLSL